MAIEISWDVEDYIYITPALKVNITNNNEERYTTSIFPGLF
jgi:hypothetical protein